MEGGSAGGSGLSSLERSCLGETLPAAAENRLRMAALDYADDAQAERYLHQAAELAPQHPAVMIAFYRYHFFHNRIVQALPYAEQCLGFASRELGLDPDWRRVMPDDAGFGEIGAYGPRFFLFSLKAWGFLKMRLGELEQGRQALEKVTQLDPADHVGASGLLRVLAQRESGDGDE